MDSLIPLIINFLNICCMTSTVFLSFHPSFFNFLLEDLQHCSFISLLGDVWDHNFLVAHLDGQIIWGCLSFWTLNTHQSSLLLELLLLNFLLLDVLFLSLDIHIFLCIFDLLFDVILLTVGVEIGGIIRSSEAFGVGGGGAWCAWASLLTADGSTGDSFGLTGEHHEKKGGNGFHN